MFAGRIIGGISVFVAVVQMGSYSRAVTLIGVTKSGVSRAISRLEERIGIALFERTSRAIKLTNEGRLFHDHVSQLLDQIEAIAATAPEGDGDLRGRPRVSTDAAFGTFLLVPRLSELSARRPRLKVDICVQDRVDNFLADSIDVAVRFGEPHTRHLKQQLLLKSRVVTCASKTYLDRHGVPAHPADIISDGHHCVRLIDDVTAKPHDWNLIDHDGTASIITPECNYSTKEPSSLIGAVLNDVGIDNGEWRDRAGEGTRCSESIKRLAIPASSPNGG